MYVDIVISNAFNLNKHFFFLLCAPSNLVLHRITQVLLSTTQAVPRITQTLHRITQVLHRITQVLYRITQVLHCLPSNQFEQVGALILALPFVNGISYNINNRKKI